MSYLDICSRRRGVIHRRELMEAGLTKDAIYRLVRRGDLIPELPSVYRSRGAPRTWLQIVTAISLWAGDGSGISGRAAGAVYGLDAFHQKGPIDVVTTRYRKPPRADVRLHRTERLSDEDVRNVSGIRLVHPWRLLVDLAGSMSPDRLEKTLEEMIRRRLATPEEIDDQVARCLRGTRGLARCKEVISRRAIAEPAAESDLETECLQDLRRGGAPLPIRQHWIYDGARRLGRIDLAYPHARLGIEVDGYRWHGTYRSFHADRERYNSAVAAGWRLLLYTKKTNKKRFVEQVISILGEDQGSLFPASR